jgi:single-strand DNA-binding protein
MSINRVVITGNLTRDPEPRETAGGMMILKMGVAVNDRRKNPQSGEWEDVPNFFDVVMFGKRAESLSRFLTKGSKVAVEGKLRWSQWDDKDSGAKRSKVEIVADDIEFMSSRGEGGGGGGGSYSAPTSKTPADPVIDDDIPF